ncbi:MAG: Spy/CpxP family protein refolding chaperone [Coleofasciculus sp. C3-bin4]|nr:Spy/CpxP family protein refolding chaperone [Coleofasciculus sp. C3-bin4]
MLLSRASVISVLLLSLGGAVALANPKPLLPKPWAQNQDRPRRAERDQPKLIEQLNLTEEQKQKLQAIQTQYKDQISQRKQALRQATQELRDLMAGNASADEIRAKHRQVQGLRQQMEEVSFESMLAMREVLTPEQRSQFARLIEQRRANFRNQMENRRGSQG